MSQIRSFDSSLEKAFDYELKCRGITTYTKNDNSIFGKPDFAFKARKVAIFCDSEFWHGFNWKDKNKQIKTNRDFWIPKIERNIKRDEEVTGKLKAEG